MAEMHGAAYHIPIGWKPARGHLSAVSHRNLTSSGKCRRSTGRRYCCLAVQPRRKYTGGATAGPCSLRRHPLFACGTSTQEQASIAHPLTPNSRGGIKCWASSLWGHHGSLDVQPDLVGPESEEADTFGEESVKQDSDDEPLRAKEVPEVRSEYAQDAGFGVPADASIEPALQERGLHFAIAGSFYRKEGVLGRDLSVLAAALQRLDRGQLRVLDVMCGSGIRGLRYLVQAGADEVWCNDACVDHHAALLANLQQAQKTRNWNIEVEEGVEHSSTASGRAEGIAQDQEHQEASVDKAVEAQEASLRRNSIGEQEVGGSHPAALPEQENFADTSSTGVRPKVQGLKGAATEVDSWVLDGSSEGRENDEWRRKRQGKSGRQEDSWRITHEDANRVLFRCYQVKDYYDLIDVDSFGSDSVFLGSALMAVKRGGLLYVTCTDGFSSGGHAPNRCLGAYGAYVKPLPYGNEVGLRMLIGGVIRAAAVLSLKVEPLFTHYSFHGPVFRAMVRVVPTRAWEPIDYEFIAHCHLCGQPQRVQWESLGGVTCSCSDEPRPLTVSGPIYTGPLHSSSFVERMSQLAMTWHWIDPPPDQSATWKGAKSRQHQKGGAYPDLGVLLRIMQEESDPRLPPWYLHMDKLAKLGRMQSPQRASLIAALHQRGFAASRSHVEPRAIKTNCPVQEIIRIAKDMV